MDSKTSRELLLRWLLALGCFATVIFFFSPCWGAFSLWARVPEMGGMLEVRRGVSVLAQVAHPGAAISDPLHGAIQWRLLFPVIGYLLNLPTPAFFALADVGCVVVLGYIITLLRREELGWWETFLATTALGAASWFFVSTGWLGYFDSWLALSLLIVAFANPSWSVWAACLWAPWIDERFIMAAPVAFACRWLRHAAQGAGTPPPFAWRRELGVPAILLAGFLLVRLGLLSGQTAGNATVLGYFSGKRYLDAPFGRILLGIWDGLRLGWIFVLATFILLRRCKVGAVTLGAGVLLTVLAGLATAQDYSRSMTMILPVAVLGVILLTREKPASRPRLLGITAAAALLLPAHHVMNDRVNPIYYLYHEIAAMSIPPRIAMPEVHELAAIHAMEQGEFAAAESELALAIRLSANPASPAKQRGVLYASSQRWEQAKKDFTTVIECEPDNPDGWFLRAQVELAMRNLEAARADFDHARSIAPAGWTNRPDVTRFTAVFNQQTGKR